MPTQAEKHDMNPYVLMFMDSIKPAMIVLFNYIFIPSLVDWFSYFEGYQMKSRRHKFNLLKQFIFILIASVCIPLTGSETINEFVQFMLRPDQDWAQFHLEMATKFIQQSDYFLRYLIQCTFLTNMLAFLDIPHFLYMKKKQFSAKYSDELEDDWYFDLGYHYAFSISMFIITLIFSTSAPLLTIFGCFFFSIKVTFARV
jgi:hypothetical protein